MEFRQSITLKSLRKIEDYQKECDKYILRSLNFENYLQKVQNSTLSSFDDKKIISK